MTNTINKKTLKELEKIAMECSVDIEMRGGLEAKGNDTDDFPEVSILGLQAMLEKAYLLGRKDATGK